MEGAKVAGTLLLLLGIVASGAFSWLVKQPWSAGEGCSDAPGPLQDACRGDTAFASGTLSVAMLLTAFILALLGATILLAERLKAG